MKKRKVLFISSTGGHFSELLELEPLFKNYDYNIITEKDVTTESLKDKYQEKIMYLPYCTRSKFFSYIFIYFYLCLKTIYYYFKLKPEIIVTTGTHTAVPMCYIAKIFGSKVIFIETFANRTTATVAGKLVYPIADTFVVQWEEMHKIYPKSVCWGWLY